MWTVQGCQTVIFAYFCLKTSGNLVGKKIQADDQLITQSIKEGRYCIVFYICFSSKVLSDLLKNSNKEIQRCITYNGAKLFNMLPLQLRKIKNPDTIKTMSKVWIWKNIPSYDVSYKKLTLPIHPCFSKIPLTRLLKSVSQNNQFFFKKVNFSNFFDF